MLQGAAFLALFRANMEGRGRLADLRIDTLEKVDLKSDGADAVAEIFADVSKDRVTAARKTLAFLENKNAQPQALMSAGRRLVFNKGRDSYACKFSSAPLDACYHAT